MPPPKGTSASLPPQIQGQDLLLVIGQLLEANKQQAEDIKTLTSEVRQYATTVVAAAKTLEIIERTVGALDRVVRVGNGDESLVSKVNGNTKLVKELEQRVTVSTSTVVRNATEANNMQAAITTLGRRADDMDTKVEDIDDRVARHDNNATHTMGMTNTLLWVGSILAWVVTTGVALYAAFKDK